VNECALKWIHQNNTLKTEMFLKRRNAPQTGHVDCDALLKIIAKGATWRTVQKDDMSLDNMRSSRLLTQSGNRYPPELCVFLDFS